MDQSAVAEIVGAIAGLLLVAAATMAASRRLGVPFTVALVLVGIGLAEAAQLGVAALEPLARLRMPPEVAFFVFMPTLVFESAYNLDTRALRENLSPVLALAIPGLLVSTLVIGAFVALFTDLGWVAALLLGSILSATDPVAVIAIFRQLGAPKRLAALVEGESLFNDATAIVLSTILVGMLGAEAAVSTGLIARGVAQFALVFFGGLLVGWAAALAVGWVLGKVENDSFIEISLTTVLAYFSFLLAEVTLELSGVMAVVAAGVMLGGWGKTKVSPEVASYMRPFWEYLSTVANALIFLMVGLTIDLPALAANLFPLLVVVVSMTLSRALVIYGLVPALRHLPGVDPIDRRYQTVMFWGGLRGGVALAIALSFREQLPAAIADEFVALVAGAVLFSLLAQGLTIERIVRHFGLDQPPLPDRLARLEGLISAKRRTLEQVPELRDGGLFAPRVAEGVVRRCREGLARLHQALDELRGRELDVDQERRLLYLRCFAAERNLYFRMFSRGHLSERAFRNLSHSIELQTEAIRHEGHLPSFTLHPPTGERFETVFYRFIDSLPWIGRRVESLRAARTARDYEVAWARSRGSHRVLGVLDELAGVDAARPEVVEQARASYQYWHEGARGRLDQNAEQFPEFVSATQERLADRLVLHAEREAIEERAHAGIIPEGVAEAMLAEMAEELRALRATEVRRLRIEPGELLKKVPFFRDMPEADFEAVAARLRPRTAPAGDTIVRQGDRGDAMFLVARGVVRVKRTDDGITRDVATLIAGDFFGEMALLHGTRRTATCRAVTPCALYELRRQDLEAVLATHPGIRQVLEETAARRRAELDELAALERGSLEGATTAPAPTEA
ncbi:MAG: hypothetical protein D6701_13895 [Gemmatimonadetes bacterium]|nr:MAG: hypothetical protein D6701_13895 [Gemmatimonadota bacterium]